MMEGVSVVSLSSSPPASRAPQMKSQIDAGKNHRREGGRDECLKCEPEMVVERIYR